MSPYLTDQDLILVLKTNKHKVGDVVGFKLNNQIFIKRVVEAKNNLFYALGDNQSDSLDSRKFGWLNRDSIVFKLIFRF
jgi:phage repressor protein C with HTH and peptisase S24 domain